MSSSLPIPDVIHLPNKNHIVHQRVPHSRVLHSTQHDNMPGTDPRKDPHHVIRIREKLRLSILVNPSFYRVVKPTHHSDHTPEETSPSKIIRRRPFLNSVGVHIDSV